MSDSLCLSHHVWLGAVEWGILSISSPVPAPWTWLLGYVVILLAEICLEVTLLRRSLELLTESSIIHDRVLPIVAFFQMWRIRAGSCWRGWSCAKGHFICRPSLLTYAHLVLWGHFTSWFYISVHVRGWLYLRHVLLRHSVSNLL